MNSDGASDHDRMARLEPEERIELLPLPEGSLGSGPSLIARLCSVWCACRRSRCLASESDHIVHWFPAMNDNVIHLLNECIPLDQDEDTMIEEPDTVEADIAQFSEEVASETMVTLKNRLSRSAGFTKI